MRCGSVIRSAAAAAAAWAVVCAPAADLEALFCAVADARGIAARARLERDVPGGGLVCQARLAAKVAEAEPPSLQSGAHAAYAKLSVLAEDAAATADVLAYYHDWVAQCRDKCAPFYTHGALYNLPPLLYRKSSKAAAVVVQGKPGVSFSVAPKLGSRDFGRLHLEEKVFWSIHNRELRARGAITAVAVEAGLWSLVSSGIDTNSDGDFGWHKDKVNAANECSPGNGAIELLTRTYTKRLKDRRVITATHAVIWINGMDLTPTSLASMFRLCVAGSRGRAQCAVAGRASLSLLHSTGASRRHPSLPPSHLPPSPCRSIGANVVASTHYRNARRCVHAVLHRWADDIAAGKFTLSLFGHSLGGAIAIKLAELEGLHADVVNPAPLLADSKQAKALAVVAGRALTSLVPFARLTFGAVRRWAGRQRSVGAWDAVLPSSGRWGSFLDEVYDYMSSQLRCAPFDPSRAAGSATIHIMLGDPVAGCYLREGDDNSLLGFKIIRYPNFHKHITWEGAHLSLWPLTFLRVRAARGGEEHAAHHCTRLNSLCGPMPCHHNEPARP